MLDRSRVVEEFLSGPQEGLSRFFVWVATLEPDHSDRGYFIRDTKRTLELGGDAASEVRIRGLPHVTGPFQELLAKWRTAGSPRP